MNHESWRPTNRAESEYARSVREIFERLVQRAAGIPAQVVSTAEFISRYAEQAATRMITGLYFSSARTWREAARASGRTDFLYRALQREMQGEVGRRVRELVRENAQLITTLPPSVARKVARLAAAHAQAGGRAAELVGGGGPLSRLARSSAKLIARTEIAKANTALQQARSEELDLPAYIWETSQDERVRLSHRKMQGVLVFWDDPPAPEKLVGMPNAPAPYPPGGIYNCRCYPAPVVRLTNLTWPRKVYWRGVVRYMTLSQVRKLYATKEAA